MRVERSIEIAAPPEAVWDVLMDPQRLEDWVTIHVALEQAPADGRLEIGSRLVQRLRLAGRTFSVDWHVVEVDAPRRAVWEGKGPVRSRALVIYELAPHDEGTCFDYVNEYKLPGGPLGRIGGSAVAPLSQRESQRSLERLQALLAP